MAGEEIRAALSGGDAKLGQIPSRDVARLLIHLEAVLAAASYAALRQPRRTGTGRHRAAVEAASRLLFRAVEPGSVVTVLGLPVLAPDDEQALDLELDDLAGAALDQVLRSREDAAELVDPALARALAELSDQLAIGVRYSTLTVSSERSLQTLILDASARSYFRQLADRPSLEEPNVLVGSLREADFDRRTARLRTATNESVSVTFGPELEKQVQEALRSQSQLEGDVTYDAVTGTARSVQLRVLTSPLPLPFDNDWLDVPVSVDELARAQGIAPADLTRPLFEASDQERREIAEALAELDG